MPSKTKVVRIFLYLVVGSYLLPISLLKSVGVKAIFTPGTKVQDVILEIKNNLKGDNNDNEYGTSFFFFFLKEERSKAYEGGKKRIDSQHEKRKMTHWKEFMNY